MECCKLWFREETENWVTMKVLIFVVATWFSFGIATAGEASKSANIKQNVKILEDRIAFLEKEKTTND